MGCVLLSALGLGFVLVVEDATSSMKLPSRNHEPNCLKLRFFLPCFCGRIVLGFLLFLAFLRYEKNFMVSSAKEIIDSKLKGNV